MTHQSKNNKGAEPKQLALADLKEKAEKGEVEAQVKLAEAYHYGEGVQQDYKECFKWATLATAQASPKGQYRLASLYRRGFGVAKDVERATKLYQKARKGLVKSAEKGNARASFMLGIIFEQGLGIAADKKQALKWFVKAAEQGDAKTQNRLGLWHETGQNVKQDFKAARHWYRKAAEQGDIHALNNLGIMYSEGTGVPKSPKIAIEWYTNALKIRLKQLGEEHPDVAKSYSNIAEEHKSMGQYQLALMLYQKALVIYRKQGANNIKSGRALNRIGMTLSAMGQHDEALKSYDNALKIFIINKVGPEVAACLNNKGEHWRHKADFKKAMEFYVQAKNLLLAIDKDHPYLGMTHNNISIIHGLRGQHDLALASLQEALKITRREVGDDHPDIALSYNNIADTYREMAKFKDALEYNKEAQKICLRHLGPDHPQLSLSYYNTGITLYQMGQFNEALESLQKALGIYRRNKMLDHLDAARIYNAIGETYRVKAEFKSAREHFLEALKIYRKKKIENHPDMANLLMGIGSMWLQNRMFNQSLVAMHESLRIFEFLFGKEHPWVATARNNIGNVHATKGDFAEALKFHQEALRIWQGQLGLEHPDLAKGHFNIAHDQYFLRKDAAALAAARKAQSIEAKHLGYVLSFTSERERLAFQQIQRPFDLLGTLGSAPDLAEAILDNKGIVLSSFLEDQLEARASSDPKISQLVEECWAASQFLNKLQMELPKDTSDKGWKQYRARLEATQTKAEAIQKQLAENVVGLGKARNSLSLTVQDVKGVLAPGTLLVDYIEYNHLLQRKKGEASKFETRYGAIMLTKKGEPVWVPLGSAKNIEDLISRYHDLLKSNGATDAKLEPVLRDLHDRLMAPVLTKLPKGTKTLIISPDGPLNFVSFATLLTKQDRFLCEDYQIQYVSSGRDLALKQEAQGRFEDKMVVFANPDFEGQPMRPKAISDDSLVSQLRSVDRETLRKGLTDFKPLPHTENEAQRLRAQGRSWGLKTEVQKGAKASKERLNKVQSPWILHLATHGFFLTEDEVKKTGLRRLEGMSMLSGTGQPTEYHGPLKNPMYRSGVALTGAQRTLNAWKSDKEPELVMDGILTAAEASLLNLSGTWLVTLSACETGLGELVSGEGVLGLRRAFIQAGTENLLMTLWSVYDEHAPEFMERFYDRAWETKDAPRALWEVQRDMLVEIRQKYAKRKDGTRLAVQIAGAFVLSYRRPAN